MGALYSGCSYLADQPPPLFSCAAQLAALHRAVENGITLSAAPADDETPSPPPKVRDLMQEHCISVGQFRKYYRAFHTQGPDSRERHTVGQLQKLFKVRRQAVVRAVVKLTAAGILHFAGQTGREPVFEWGLSSALSPSRKAM